MYCFKSAGTGVGNSTGGLTLLPRFLDMHLLVLSLPLSATIPCKWTLSLKQNKSVEPHFGTYTPSVIWCVVKVPSEFISHAAYAVASSSLRIPFHLRKLTLANEPSTVAWGTSVPVQHCFPPTPPECKQYAIAGTDEKIRWVFGAGHRHMLRKPIHVDTVHLKNCNNTRVWRCLWELAPFQAYCGFHNMPEKGRVPLTNRILLG